MHAWVACLPQKSQNGNSFFVFLDRGSPKIFSLGCPFVEDMSFFQPRHVCFSHVFSQKACKIYHQFCVHCCNPLLFWCRFNFGNFGTSIFLPELNLYLNFSSGLTDAAACLLTSGSHSRYRFFLRTETANFRFTENCTLPK